MDEDLISTGLDELEDIFYIFNPEGDFIEWNEQLPSVSGYSAEELDSMEPTELFTGDDQDAIEDAVETVLDREIRTAVQAKIETKGGREIAYELSMSPLKPENELEAIVGIGRDITEQLEQERRLQDMAQEIQELSMPVVEIWDEIGRAHV